MMTPSKENYSAEEIASLLGVNAASVYRWADSGKLKFLTTEDGMLRFSIDHLIEFSIAYNVSMRFLFEAALMKKPVRGHQLETVSAMK